MPRSTFITLKEEDRLGLGVQGDGAQWLAEARQMLDFNLQRLAHRARSGKFEGVRLEAGTLIVTATAGGIPVAAEELIVGQPVPRRSGSKEPLAKELCRRSS